MIFTNVSNSACILFGGNSTWDHLVTSLLFSNLSKLRCFATRGCWPQSELMDLSTLWFLIIGSRVLQWRFIKQKWLSDLNLYLMWNSDKFSFNRAMSILLKCTSNNQHVNNFDLVCKNENLKYCQEHVRLAHKYSNKKRKWSLLPRRQSRTWKYSFLHFGMYLLIICLLYRLLTFINWVKHNLFHFMNAVEQHVVFLYPGITGIHTNWWELVSPFKNLKMLFYNL